MKGELVILGCGGSSGVPAIGNWWGKCDPHEPKNRRTRPSVAILKNGSTLIVDSGPDFREQYNRENLTGLDGVLFTHTHSDHVNGIDELRTFQRLQKRTYPIYGDAKTLDVIGARFDYMFATTENGFYPAVCEPVPITPGRVTCAGIAIDVFEQDHGTTVSLGIRIGTIGYSTDFKRLDDRALEVLKGIDIWIADAAAHDSKSNPVHASVEDVIALNQTIGAKQVYLTHLPPTMDYRALTESLPPGFAPAYDGLRLPLE